MTEKLELNDIRAYWTRQAEEHGLDSAASWSDRPVIEMEIREIMDHLADGDRVLDVGCANGFSTVCFAEQRRIDILGLDYIPEMIDAARKRLASPGITLRGTAAFDVGNIMDLGAHAARFDKLVVVRVLINLGTWERQAAALGECRRALKPGGMLLLSEATTQGWRRLNAFRQEWGLPDIPMPPFNTYLDEQAVIDAAGPELELVEVRNFASTYYVGTRVLKPLLAKATAAALDVANPNAEWNRWFAAMPPAGDYGTQKLFIFRRRR
jgi:ubiquinone/menaquinone biosynthesis C-methylase UbiE